VLESSEINEENEKALASTREFEILHSSCIESSATGRRRAVGAGLLHFLSSGTIIGHEAIMYQCACPSIELLSSPSFPSIS
jgi:hypothetical protein